MSNFNENKNIFEPDINGNGLSRKVREWLRLGKSIFEFSESGEKVSKVELLQKEI